jgi:hypothetical protein
VTAFDATVTVGGLDLAVPNEEALKNGVRPHVEVILTIVQPLPIAKAPGEPVIAPLGTLKFPIARDQAVEFFRQGLEQAEQLPAESKLEISNDLSAAHQAAEALKGMRGDG